MTFWHCQVLVLAHVVGVGIAVGVGYWHGVFTCLGAISLAITLQSYMVLNRISRKDVYGLCP